MKKLLMTNQITANALSDPSRIRLLEILYHKQMSTSQLVEELANSGFKKATTTIRHHLDILKSAGLVEVSQMEEVRGTVMKYYAPTVRLIVQESVNSGFEDKNSRLIDSVSSKILKLFGSIMNDKKFVSDIVFKKCNLCERNHMKEYLAFEIISSAFAKATQSPDYLNLLKTAAVEKKETSHLKKQ